MTPKVQENPQMSYVEVTEQKRLYEAREHGIPWKKWGPYLSERQWGTVREDYSQNGDAWNYFSHDQARFRAYRWGEDGLAGISDDKKQLRLTRFTAMSFLRSPLRFLTPATKPCDQEPIETGASYGDGQQISQS